MLQLQQCYVNRTIMASAQAALCLLEDILNPKQGCSNMQSEPATNIAKPFLQTAHEHVYLSKPAAVFLSMKTVQ